ncbi:MAG: hypothetical protein KatS3mg057_1980 [Herpetosiphonaceae bacterium]|nr:MAG: hypothetical protein KatS3mg057_1980 [Herpetosiphonaceae bacterium]
MKQGHHCPYLGLKHNRAIRFASPTPEHRCYVSGDPQEIPVDQARYCLSANHVRCPLYTGEMLASMVPITRRQGGVRGWISSLTPRDRAIYGALVGMLGVILIIYAVGIYLLWTKNTSGIVSGEILQTPTEEGQALAVTVTASATPTSLKTPSATPRSLPTPTSSPSATPSATPTEIAVLATSSPTQPASPSPATATPTSIPPTNTPMVVPPTPSPVPSPLPTATMAPPATRPLPTSQAEPPGPTVSVVLLYFGDPSGRLLIPVTRSIQPTNQWRTAALQELLKGPKGRLSRVIAEGTELLSLSISGNLATVNLSQHPGSTLAIQSIVLSITERTDVTQVQIQVNGSNITAQPLFRPNINKDNPQELSGDFATTEFLPLYFPLNDAPYYVRVTRLIPKTKSIARETVQGLIDGPGQYSNLLGHPIPAGTTIRSIVLRSGTLTVDFSAAFADAVDRQQTIDTLLLSLTTFASVDRVVIMVEGRGLGELWGSQYAGPLTRPALNPE